MKNTDNFREAEKFILQNIKSNNYPQGHPFLEYPKPDGMIVGFLIQLKLLLNDNEAILSLIKKCQSTVDGVFNWERYNQNSSEVIILYYIIVGVLKNKQTMFDEIFYESGDVFSNNKKLEYSFLFKDHVLINFEVKTLTCDPLIKENALKIHDGQLLIKPFYKDCNIDALKAQFPQSIIIENSSNYRQLSKNVKKIIDKFDGENLTQYNLINIGVVIINFSTSLEEFFSYLYNKEKGLLFNTKLKALDALVLFSLDNSNDMELQNIYDMGYIQTALIKDNAINREYLKTIRMDNYMSWGNTAYESILNSAKEFYGVYKILKREGFISIVPWDATEEEINTYVNDLKHNAIRGKNNKTM